ncbi:MAG: DUF3792 family protein [Clostridia bacterium]|nr:DUF3792 family protein [Clostridia bacterium]
MQIDRRITGVVLDVLKCVGIALVTSLALELLFALLIKVFSLPNSVISPVNQCIKVISVFLGCFFGFSPEMGIIKGGIGGALSIVLTKLVFSFLAGSITWSLWFLAELLFGIVVGVLCGIITVNVKK